MTFVKCPVCNGARLKPEFLAVTINDLNIHQFCSLSIDDAYDFIRNLKLDGSKQTIAKDRKKAKASVKKDKKNKKAKREAKTDK